jgi:hypothetical protein
MWLIKHHITNLFGKWRHSCTHFNHCCRYRWFVMPCPLPNQQNLHYLFNKLDWLQGQYRCDSIVFMTVFCIMWVYMLEVWGAFIPSLKPNCIVTWGCKLFVEQDPNWCQSVHKKSLCVTVSLNISTKHSMACFVCFVFKSQSPIVCLLAKWLAKAVPLAIQCAAASSSNIHELLLLQAKFELCF